MKWTGLNELREKYLEFFESKGHLRLQSFPLIPHYAVLDPALTYTLPPHLTATTGMDALTHAVEAFLSNAHTPFSDGAAIEAIRLVSKSLKRATHFGRDIQARTDMCWAEYLAGLAFSNSGITLIAGGLIETKAEVTNALHCGAFAVSTGKKELWYI